jgi:arylsulfatase A-like enzyme
MDLPNILLIMTDQQKATASHLYGNPFCTTPALEHLAQQGVLFENAYTPHPLCVPARIALWTGQYPHTTGTRTNRQLLPAGTAHATRAWQEAGYHVGLIGKNHCFEQPEDLACFDTWCEISHHGLSPGAACRGMEWFRPLEGIHAAHAIRRQMPPINSRFSYAVTDHPLEDYSTGLIAGQTVRFLEKHRHVPFALWVSFPDPHGPWQVPESYAALFPDEVLSLPPWRADEFTDGTAPERNIVMHRMMGIQDEPPAQVKGLLRAYYGMVRFVDDAVGQILGALENLGLTENTIVIFCSDHGDYMGEHQLQAKGGQFYDCLTRVPLIVAWPGSVPAGVRVADPVSLLDVIPTLYELQGIYPSSTMDGRPLPVVTGAAPRRLVLAEYGAGGPPFRLAELEQLPGPHDRQTFMQTLHQREAEGLRKMIRVGKWKYVHDPLGDRDECYDLDRDPWELTNLAADPGCADLVDDLRASFDGWAL